MGRNHGSVAGKGLVYYSGYNDGTYPTRKDGKITDEHTVWRGMLRRCYGDKGQPFYNAYVGCGVSDNFKQFKFFHEWCQDQTGFGCREENGTLWHLDKDLLIPGNKEYHEDRCVFIPHWLNQTLINTKYKRGDCPIGVRRSGKGSTFIASITIRCQHITLGYFACPLQAFEVYKKARDDYMRSIAISLQGRVDARLFDRLYNFEVSADD